jgi:phosphohistidine swiveling domain-containing protein
MNYLKTFQEAIATEHLGGKAFRLIQMQQAGFNVPSGAVLLPEAFQLFLDMNPNLNSVIGRLCKLLTDKEIIRVHKEFSEAVFPKVLEAEIRTYLSQRPTKSWAIRSSGSMEDGSNASFAGQFESYLDAKNPDDVIQSIVQCWSSLYGQKVVRYCENKNLPLGECKMSVIIQELIPSEASGVVFTVNPMTGNDKQMVIEAVSGLGESLVQGQVTPDHYLYDWYHEKLEIKSEFDQPHLNNEQIVSLSEKCLDIQQFYGEPMDIEWAIDSCGIHILQARPLTAIHFDIKDEWTTADLKDGGISSSIATPMMFSLYEYIFENTMPEYFRLTKILPKRTFDKWFNWWFGYSYWNIGAAKEGVHQLPGFNERNFDTSLGIEPNYEGDGRVTGMTLQSLLHGIPILLATNRSIKSRIQNCKEDIVYVIEKYRQVDEFLKSEPDLNALISTFRTFVLETYLRMEGHYFFTVYDNSNAATFCQDAVDKANKKQPRSVNYLNLVTGLSDLSHMRPTFDLWNLVEKIRQNPEAASFYAHRSVSEVQELLEGPDDFPFKTELKAFFQNYYFHSLRELDLMVPNWDEDFSQGIKLLQSFLRNDQHENPIISEQRQEAIYKNELSKINDKSLLKAVQTHRDILWWREEMRDYSSRAYYFLRKFLLKISDEMIKNEWIAEADDVHFLTFQELIAFAETEDVDFYQKLIYKNKKFFRSFRNFKNPNEIRQSKVNEKVDAPNGQDQDTFQGIAGSYGHAVGRAVVVKTVFEADKIEKGDILVTKFTDPGWTVYFAKIAGLITESGGILSHGAVVSREYGIPAIFGIKNITKKIKTGDLLEMDGEHGIIKIISHD